MLSQGNLPQNLANIVILHFQRIPNPMKVKGKYKNILLAHNQMIDVGIAAPYLLKPMANSLKKTIYLPLVDYHRGVSIIYCCIFLF